MQQVRCSPSRYQQSDLGRASGQGTGMHARTVLGKFGSEWRIERFLLTQDAKFFIRKTGHRCRTTQPPMVNRFARPSPHIRPRRQIKGVSRRFCRTAKVILFVDFAQCGKQENLRQEPEPGFSDGRPQGIFPYGMTGLVCRNGMQLAAVNCATELPVAMFFTSITSFLTSITDKVQNSPDTASDFASQRQNFRTPESLVNGLIWNSSRANDESKELDTHRPVI